MSVQELLQNPPPFLADVAQYLNCWAEHHGWTPKEVRPIVPLKEDSAVAESVRDFKSVDEVAEATKLPERTVRSHARRYHEMPHAPFYVDRKGPRGGYRIDIREYGAWREGVSQGKNQSAMFAEDVEHIIEEKLGQLR